MATFYPRAHPATNERFTANTANSNNISALELFISNERIKQYFEDFNKNGNSQVLLGGPGGTAVLADSTILPIADPDKREGWLFENTVPGSKYNLYFFGGAQEILTLGSIASLWVKMYIDAKPDNSVMPFLIIYTKPTGVGDAGAFYHSKITYSYVEGTIGIGEEMVLFAIDEPSRGFSNRKLQLANKIVLGDGLDDEEVLYMTVHSDTSATIGGVRHCINQLGFNTVDLPNFPITRSLNLTTEQAVVGGDATAANQILQLDQETVTASNTSSIDGKITKGNDLTLSEAQQVLVYGEVTSGPGTGELHPIHITNAGDVEVEIADYPRGQQLMLDSFAVTIASDQSPLTVSETFLRTPSAQTLNVPAGSNAPSSGINMSPGGDPTYRKVAFFGETDNVTDFEIFVEFSNDNLNWYQSGYEETIQLAIDPNDPTRQTYYKVIECVPQWVRLQKYNNTGSAETLIIKTARIN
jgi:hypothetical protein